MPLATHLHDGARVRIPDLIEGAGFLKAAGTVVDRVVLEDKGLVIKIVSDEDVECWYLASRLVPLLKIV